MTKFIVQRLFSMLLTMFIVSIAVFLISELTPGDVARHILGPFATPEQVDLFRAQLGFEQPLYLRYVNWLFGSDWRVSGRVGHSFVTMKDSRSGSVNWWADVDGTPTRWKMKEGEMVIFRMKEDGTVEEDEAFTGWKTNEAGEQYFWGVDTANHATLWKKGVTEEQVGPASAGRAAVEQTGGVEYIPLQRGLLRGDPGVSFRTGRPVADTLFIRLLTIGGLTTTASPNFATGILLILVFAAWLKVLPGAVVLLDDKAIFTNLDMLVLPVATLTLIELGYVLRITRASMVEVMNAPYIRTAFLKGLPYRRIVLKHALRNAMMAPITVIMLHVNWLMGGIVVVEVLFSFPGLGQYLLDSALFNDVFAIEAGAMVMVVLAVGTQLVADIIYTFLNPRIRYG
jgi:peptide/nickel transport system permease protein